MNPLSQPAGIIFTTPTGFSEIDELNRILSVERELVLRTQENYRTLKDQFIELNRENELLKRDIDQLTSEKLEENDSREHFAALEAKSEQVIRNMMQANQDREARYEKFKIDTIEELQNVFRKELADQNLQLEKLQADRNDLIKENDNLLEKVTILKSELDDMKRKERAKEADIRQEFDNKLKKVINEKEEKLSPRLAHYTQSITKLQEQIHELEKEKIENTIEYSQKLAEKNLKIDAMLKNETDWRVIRNENELKIERLEQAISELKSEENKHEYVIENLNKKIDIHLKERLEIESKLRQNDREWSKRLENADEKFSKRIVEFEKLCESKDEQLVELQYELEKFEEIENNLKESEKIRQIEQEHRERLELEVKVLYGKLESIGEEKQKFASDLKMERDKLEQSVAQLKKQLETTPDTVAEVAKLKSELRHSEKKRSNDKEKYQSALADMKMAITSIERQQRNTREKLREKIVDS